MVKREKRPSRSARWRMAVRLPVALLAGMLLAGTAASAGHPTTIQSLSATAGADAVTVAGEAKFTETHAVLATDPTDSAGVLPGSELTSAAISQLNADTLALTIGIDGQGPAGGTPELLQYRWSIVVSPGDRSTSYRLEAMRTGQFWAVGGAAPTFRVQKCTHFSSTNCATAVKLNGAMSDDEVRFELPLSLIGARRGSAITLGPEGLWVRHGTSGLLTLTARVDEIVGLSTYEIVSPAILLGIGQANVSDEYVPLTRLAQVNPDGTFTGTLPLPEDGAYQVVARACISGACAVRSINLRVGPEPQPTPTEEPTPEPTATAEPTPAP